MGVPVRKSRKIPMKKIEDKAKRMVSFSKRRNGLFSMANKLAALTGSEIAVVAISEAGRPYAEGSMAALDRFLAANGGAGGEESRPKPNVVVGLEDWIGVIHETLADGGAELGDLVELRREVEGLRDCLRGRLVELKEEDRFAFVNYGGDGVSGDEIGRR